MIKIPHVASASAFRFSIGGQNRVLVTASGLVSTSGWSNIRLSPSYYAVPPADGVWEIDLVGDPPAGIALQVELSVTASDVFAVPDWMKGIRVNGTNAEIGKRELVALQAQQPIHFQARNGNVIVRHGIASYDDSHQPIGMCGAFSVKMKKLSHSMTLVVEGPDEKAIRDCINQSTGVGLIAAIVAVYATGGGALSAAVSAFLANLKGCLGNSFEVRIDDESHWVEWCT